MINVAVLAGGCAPEHAISLRSAAQVLSHLDPGRYARWPVLLSKDGSWWVSRQPLAAGVRIGSDFRVPGMQPMLPGRALAELLETAEIDVVFPALHGAFGEDGTVQGMLALHGVPFVGSGCAASAVAMDKIRTRECLLAHGIPMPAAYVSSTPLHRVTIPDEIDAVRQSVGFPAFAKVDFSGSSLGVQRVDSGPQLAQFLVEHKQMGRRFMVEAEVRGEEITVPVLGNTGEHLEVLPAIGIYPRLDRYFTFDAKYDSSATDEVIPPRHASQADLEAAAELGRRCHEALVCDGMSRTDIILGEDGPRVLEVNTIPGLTRESLLPKAAAARGYAFGELLDQLVNLALRGDSRRAGGFETEQEGAAS